MAATILMDDPDLETEIQPVPRDDDFYEVVNGERIGKPLMSAYAVKVGSRLSAKLAVFIDDKDLGEVVSEMLFRLPLKEDASRNRRPDLAYVSFARWPADRPMPARRRLGCGSRPRRRSDQSNQPHARDDAESPGVFPGRGQASLDCLPTRTPDLHLRVTEANPCLGCR